MAATAILHRHLLAALRHGGIKNNQTNRVGLAALREQAAGGALLVALSLPHEILPPAAFAEPRHAARHLINIQTAATTVGMRKKR